MTHKTTVCTMDGIEIEMGFGHVFVDLGLPGAYTSAVDTFIDTLRGPATTSP